MNRRRFPLAAGAGSAAIRAAEAKLLLPSDQPDEHGFRLMWYNPVSPIDQKTWRRARVRLTAGGRTQMDEVRSGGSYLSQNNFRLHFGLGLATRIERIEIEWPSGQRQVERDIDVNRIVTIRETRAPVP
jgi:hypothetical protein